MYVSDSQDLGLSVMLIVCVSLAEVHAQRAGEILFLTVPAKVFLEEISIW